MPLSPADTTCVADPGGGAAEAGWAVERRRTGEAAKPAWPGEAAEATGAGARAGAESEEPAKGIAEAVIGRVIVAWRALGMVAAARPDTTVTRKKSVTRRANRDRWSRSWSRSEQYS